MTDWDKTVIDTGETLGHTSPAAFMEILDEFDAEEDDSSTTISLPWPSLDNRMGDGFRPGEVTVLAGLPGYGKSYMAMSICLHAHYGGAKWMYQPFEEDARAALKRFLALLEGSWAIMDKSHADVAERRATTLRRQPELREINENVCENPRRPYRGPDGTAYVGTVGYDRVLRWVQANGDEKDLLVLDPMAMIDFTGENGRTPEWQGQQEFIKQLVGIAQFTKCHILLVCHLGKKGAPKGQPLSQADVQGAAALTRFCQNVLLLDRHEEKNSDIWFSSAMPEQSVTHRYTLYIEKSRNGPGAGSRIAFEFGATPAFKEFGLIKPRGRG